MIVVALVLAVISYQFPTMEPVPPWTYITLPTTSVPKLAVVEVIVVVPVVTPSVTEYWGLSWEGPIRARGTNLEATAIGVGAALADFPLYRRVECHRSGVLEDGRDGQCVAAGQRAGRGERLGADQLAAGRADDEIAVDRVAGRAAGPRLGELPYWVWPT